MFPALFGCFCDAGSNQDVFQRGGTRRRGRGGGFNRGGGGGFNRGGGGFNRGGGGFNRGGGGFGRGGGRGGYNRQQDYGPPERVVAVGEFMHPCEDDIVCKCTTEENKVPYFNAPVYLENKEQIGKVDEIFGQLRDFYFSVKLSENMKASSFKKLQKFYIDPMKLLPLQRFLPRPPGRRDPRGEGGVAGEVEEEEEEVVEEVSGVGGAEVDAGEEASEEEEAVEVEVSEEDDSGSGTDPAGAAALPVALEELRTWIFYFGGNAVACFLCMNRCISV
ncbi:hypothetical protein OJAV_G00105710 [Oryzias javanicus]|uniref:H/ACA ribonucleoprotein complex subunit n=1 Tax=Oryzias javanicus TaxID=123683 RepID=A0A437CYB5_ORYJA|nr:hypothetical protein OJAV_G00105710 [Oryzias javanicus]